MFKPKRFHIVCQKEWQTKTSKQTGADCRPIFQHCSSIMHSIMIALYNVLHTCGKNKTSVASHHTTVYTKVSLMQSVFTVDYKWSGHFFIVIYTYGDRWAVASPFLHSAKGNPPTSQFLKTRDGSAMTGMTARWRSGKKQGVVPPSSCNTQHIFYPQQNGLILVLECTGVSHNIGLMRLTKCHVTPVLQIESKYIFLWIINNEQASKQRLPEKGIWQGGWPAMSKAWEVILGMLWRLWIWGRESRRVCVCVCL